MTLFGRCKAKGFRLCARFCMFFAGRSFFGRLAMRIAGWFVPPYRSRTGLARMSRNGYIAPSATIYHTALRLGPNVFIGDNVIIYQAGEHTGPVELSAGVRLHRDTIVETGEGGSLTVGVATNIQPRCQLSAYKGHIQIGRDVSIAPYCAFYPYDHGMAPDISIKRQPLQSKGGIIIDDDAWLGVGVIVLDGVRIGKGAVIGAGSVVVHDVPDGAVARGVPARVCMMRSDLPRHGVVSAP